MTRWSAVPSAWVGDHDRVVVLPLGTPLAPARVLSGSGADIWRALVESSDPSTSAAIAATVASELGEDPVGLELAVASFLGELAALGLTHRRAHGEANG
jgi:hypothetical protein